MAVLPIADAQIYDFRGDLRPLAVAYNYQIMGYFILKFVKQ
jgi:hypothetical protein